MRENTRYIDPDLGQRYQTLVDAFIDISQDSALVDEKKDLTPLDLTLIQVFHCVANPLKENDQWRKYSQKLTYRKRKDDPYNYALIKDQSNYKDWFQPGRAEEHRQLVGPATNIILRELLAHLKPIKELKGKNKRHAQSLLKLSPLLLQAAGDIHDDGRFFTHDFFTNELIANAFNKRVGLRSDIRKILPSEDVMLVPKRKSMRKKIYSLDPAAIILRIADEFGKRAPGTDRLYLPDDYSTWDRQKWVEGYTKKLPSGRPSDKFFRENHQLHVDNVPRYFKALDYWIKSISNLTLDDLAHTLEKELGVILKNDARMGTTTNVSSNH